jgi:CRISPR/Cas system-associated exonuclease Cas4 (RecB family)
LYHEIISRYLNAFIHYEKASCPFIYVGHEVEVSTTFEETDISLRGYIDRIDEKGGVLKITDYKTSRLDKLVLHPEKSMNVKAIGRGYVFQMFLYQYILSKTFQRKVATRLLPVNKLLSDSPQVIENSGDHPEEMDMFIGQLKELFEQIFSDESSYSQTDYKKSCEYCAYTDICNR